MREDAIPPQTSIVLNTVSARRELTGRVEDEVSGNILKVDVKSFFFIFFGVF